MPLEEQATVVVEIPDLVRAFTNGTRELEMIAGSLRDCLQELEIRFPRLKGWFIDSEGRLPDHALVFVNGDDVRRAQELSTILREGDRITMVPFVPE